MKGNAVARVEKNDPKKEWQVKRSGCKDKKCSV